MKVINIALRRADGKIETDTVYGEKFLTDEDVRSISDKFSCDVIVSVVGEVSFFDDEKIKENTIVYNRVKEVKDGNSESGEAAENKISDAT